jgi:hypothetical protein
LRWGADSKMRQPEARYAQLVMNDLRDGKRETASPDQQLDASASMR